MRTITTAILATALGMGAAAAAPMPGKTVPLRTYAEAKPLAPWTAFCEGPGKSECAVDPAQPGRIVLTPAVWKEIEAANAKVNASVTPLTDMEHWGKPDVWDLAEDGKGDAEEYALLKRRALVGKGLPRRAMRVAVVIDGTGLGHAVLCLVTDRGDLVLDSKTGEILPWYRTGYNFIKRESQDGVGWVSLGGATSPGDYEGRPEWPRDAPKPDAGSAPKP